MSKGEIDITASRREGARRWRSRRKRPVMDGPFAETKEVALVDWAGGPGCYARVNGLRMYYEIHGQGRPLVLLHAALTTIDLSFGEVVSGLAANRQVIAIEQQAHGRTADIDRSLSFEQMADDTAALLGWLGIEKADFFGFSMGGALALQMAVQHPRLTRRLAVVSGAFNRDGYNPGVADALIDIDNDPMAAVAREELQRVAAPSGQWPASVRRFQDLIRSDPGLRPHHLRSIRVPTLFVGGEQGMVRREHTSEMAALVPNARIEVLAGDDHAPDIVPRSASLVPAFLDRGSR